MSLKPEENPDSNERYRDFLKAHLWGEWKLKDLETDQRKGLPPPPLQKPIPSGANIIDLLPPEKITVGQMSILEAISRRRSRREYTEESLNMEELVFLLWSTQGVHEVIRGGKATRRTVPSGGARHPFVTYLYINRVEGLKPGIYRYLPLEHKLCLIDTSPDLGEKVRIACYQHFIGNAAVVFIWAAIPYRSEWRYGFLSHKVIAQESGHICQNLYLASEAIGAGSCAVGTYNQEEIDAILGVDGTDEFAVYIAAVGKVGQ